MVLEVVVYSRNPSRGRRTVASSRPVGYIMCSKPGCGAKEKKEAAGCDSAHSQHLCRAAPRESSLQGQHGTCQLKRVQGKRWQEKRRGEKKGREEKGREE